MRKNMTTFFIQNFDIQLSFVGLFFLCFFFLSVPAQIDRDFTFNVTSSQSSSTFSTLTLHFNCLLSDQISFNLQKHATKSLRPSNIKKTVYTDGSTHKKNIGESISHRDVNENVVSLEGLESNHSFNTETPNCSSHCTEIGLILGQFRFNIVCKQNISMLKSDWCLFDLNGTQNIGYADWI